MFLFSSNCLRFETHHVGYNRGKRNLLMQQSEDLSPETRSQKKIAEQPNNLASPNWAFRCPAWDTVDSLRVFRV